MQDLFTKTAPNTYEYHWENENLTYKLEIKTIAGEISEMYFCFNGNKSNISSIIWNVYAPYDGKLIKISTLLDKYFAKI